VQAPPASHGHGAARASPGPGRQGPRGKCRSEFSAGQRYRSGRKKQACKAPPARMRAARERRRPARARRKHDRRPGAGSGRGGPSVGRGASAPPASFIRVVPSTRPVDRVARETQANAAPRHAQQAAGALDLGADASGSFARRTPRGAEPSIGKALAFHHRFPYPQGRRNALTFAKNRPR